MTALFMIIDGVERAIVRAMRGRACDLCGSADGNHRPECKAMQAEDANDTAAVAARIDEVTAASDAPLVPPGEDSKPLVAVKPKRTSKKANGKAEPGAEA
jgi:hypothetical protein